MAKGQYQKWITEEGQALLRGWKRKELTDEQIAEKIGIRCETLWDWKKKHPNISNALKKGKQLCDFEAEEQLIGLFEGHYVTDEVTEINEVDGKKKKHVRKTKRWIEPNTTALIFYLKARAGWKEQGEEDQSQAMNRLAEMISHVEREAHRRAK